jgi:hypothetical protein
MTGVKMKEAKSWPLMKSGEGYAVLFFPLIISVCLKFSITVFKNM